MRWHGGKWSIFICFCSVVFGIWLPFSVCIIITREIAVKLFQVGTAPQQHHCHFIMRYSIFSSVGVLDIWMNMKVHQTPLSYNLSMSNGTILNDSAIRPLFDSSINEPNEVINLFAYKLVGMWYSSCPLSLKACVLYGRPGVQELMDILPWSIQSVSHNIAMTS